VLRDIIPLNYYIIKDLSETEKIFGGLNKILDSKLVIFNIKKVKKYLEKCK